jgi:hypothetical protein
MRLPSWLRVWWHCLTTGHRPAELFDGANKPIDLCADCGFPRPDAHWVYDGDTNGWREASPEEVEAYRALAALIQSHEPGSPPFMFVMPCAKTHHWKREGEA